MDLFEAIDNQDLEKVRALIRSDPTLVHISDYEYQAFPLQMAAALGNLTMVQDLLKVGAEPNRGFIETPLLEAVQEGHIEVVRELILAGADVNTIDEELRTPLMAAAVGGYLEIVQLLLKAGANPFAEDNEGQTALDKAEAIQTYGPVRNHIPEVITLLETLNI